MEVFFPGWIFGVFREELLDLWALDLASAVDWSSGQVGMGWMGELLGMGMGFPCGWMAWVYNHGEYISPRKDQVVPDSRPLPFMTFLYLLWLVNGGC